MAHLRSFWTNRLFNPKTWTSCPQSIWIWQSPPQPHTPCSSGSRGVWRTSTLAGLSGRASSEACTWPESDRQSSSWPWRCFLKSSWRKPAWSTSWGERWRSSRISGVCECEFFATQSADWVHELQVLFLTRDLTGIPTSCACTVTSMTLRASTSSWSSLLKASCTESCSAAGCSMISAAPRWEHNHVLIY